MLNYLTVLLDLSRLSLESSVYKGEAMLEIFSCQISSFWGVIALFWPRCSQD